MHYSMVKSHHSNSRIITDILRVSEFADFMVDLDRNKEPSAWLHWVIALFKDLLDKTFKATVA